MLVVLDGVGMAYMGRPFALYLSLGVILSHSIDLESPMVSPGGDPVLGFSKSCLGMRRAACVRWRFGSCARRAVVVAHAQATSRLIRSCSIGHRTSHRSGHVSSTLNGKESFSLRHFAFLDRRALP